MGRKQLEEKETPPKVTNDFSTDPETQKELDDVFIPYLESKIPRLYVDDNIRFNRKVSKWGMSYTVDFGSKANWQEMLLKTPELANFNLPDHWVENANAQFPHMPVHLVPIMNKYSPQQGLFMGKPENIPKGAGPLGDEDPRPEARDQSRELVRFRAPEL